ALAVVLMRDEGAECRAEVVARGDLGGQRREQDAAVGRLPALAAVTGVTGPEDEILDDKLLVALAGGAGGRVEERDKNLTVDGEAGILAALGGAGPLAVGVWGLGGGTSRVLGWIVGRGVRPLRRRLSPWRRASC